MTKSNIKTNVRAFRIGNHTYSLVKEFRKSFEKEMDNLGANGEERANMWLMCIRYMKEYLNKKL